MSSTLKKILENGMTDQTLEPYNTYNRYLYANIYVNIVEHFHAILN